MKEVQVKQDIVCSEIDRWVLAKTLSLKNFKPENIWGVSQMSNQTDNQLQYLCCPLRGPGPLVEENIIHQVCIFLVFQDKLSLSLLFVSNCSLTWLWTAADITMNQAVPLAVETWFMTFNNDPDKQLQYERRGRGQVELCHLHKDVLLVTITEDKSSDWSVIHVDSCRSTSVCGSERVQMEPPSPAQCVETHVSQFDSRQHWQQEDLWSRVLVTDSCFLLHFPFPLGAAENETNKVFVRVCKSTGFSSEGLWAVPSGSSHTHTHTVNTCTPINLHVQI